MYVSYDRVPVFLARRLEFDGHSMHAERVDPKWSISTGQLPDDEDLILRHARADAIRFGEDMYVVFSYRTPIAWGLDGRALYVPDVHYSRTTTRQQNLCRAYGESYGVAA